MKYRNIAISCFFILLIGYTLFFAKTYEVIPRFLPENMWNQENQFAGTSQVDTAQEQLLGKLPYKNFMIELNGGILKNLGTRSFYNQTTGINITKDGYIIGTYEQTSADYEVAQMISFKQYLDRKGISLLYVNEPIKYTDDRVCMDEFGILSYSNQNMDFFLSRLSEAQIDYLDLRESLQNQEMDCKSLFYRTDHHWTVPASKWAASVIAEKLNNDFGYSIDLSLYDEKNYDYQTWQQVWLGEQGSKVAKSYVGLDDYTMVKPNFPTAYDIIVQNDLVATSGDFNTMFIDETLYQPKQNPYNSSSWHFSYGGTKWSNTKIHNKNVTGGKVLVLGDSYEASMLPFLTLGIEDTTLIVPRNLNGQSVREIIEQGDFDIVIVAYAQFMLGAHDDPENANYSMFTLD